MRYLAPKKPTELKNRKIKLYLYIIEKHKKKIFLKKHSKPIKRSINKLKAKIRTRLSNL